MARIAVLSDIHGNLIAFERVLADVRKRGADMMVCLGDIVGYGPDPKECFDLARHCCRTIVAGNHERGVLEPSLAANWNGLARAGIEHARAQLTSDDMLALAALPATFTCEDKVFGVHDSPTPSAGSMTYLRTRSDAARAFQFVEHSIALIGHTHVPACFATITEPFAPTESDDVEAFQVARRLLGAAQEHRGAFISSAEFDLPRFGRAIVNPGSVGQPRDGDNRASYAILDLESLTVEFRRVAYDLERARLRNEASRLPVASSSRLALGA